MNNVIKLFFSREDRLGEINDEETRCQWDGSRLDMDKIEAVCDLIDERTDDLIKVAEEYNELLAPEKNPEYAEDNARVRVYKRKELVEQWALAQAALSKVAFVLRIDGNEAFHRMLDSLKTGVAVDMKEL